MSYLNRDKQIDELKYAVYIAMDSVFKDPNGWGAFDDDDFDRTKPWGTFKEIASKDESTRVALMKLFNPFNWIVLLPSIALNVIQYSSQKMPNRVGAIFNAIFGAPFALVRGLLSPVAVYKSIYKGFKENKAHKGSDGRKVYEEQAGAMLVIFGAIVITALVAVSIFTGGVFPAAALALAGVVAGLGLAGGAAVAATIGIGVGITALCGWVSLFVLNGVRENLQGDDGSMVKDILGKGEEAERNISAGGGISVVSSRSSLASSDISSSSSAGQSSNSSNIAVNQYVEDDDDQPDPSYNTGVGGGG